MNLARPSSDSNIVRRVEDIVGMCELKLQKIPHLTPKTSKLGIGFQAYLERELDQQAWSVLHTHAIPARLADVIASELQEDHYICSSYSIYSENRLTY